MMCLFFIEMCFALEMLQCFATQHEIKRCALNEMMPLASLNEICHMNLNEPQSEWITAHFTLAKQAFHSLCEFHLPQGKFHCILFMSFD